MRATNRLPCSTCAEKARQRAILLQRQRQRQAPTPAKTGMVSALKARLQMLGRR